MSNLGFLKLSPNGHLHDKGQPFVIATLGQFKERLSPDLLVNGRFLQITVFIWGEARTIFMPYSKHPHCNGSTIKNARNGDRSHALRKEEAIAFDFRIPCDWDTLKSLPSPRDKKELMATISKHREKIAEHNKVIEALENELGPLSVVKGSSR